MNTIVIDTNKAITKLTNKGFSRNQAEGVVEVLTEGEFLTTGYLDRRITELEKRMYRAMLIQTGSISAIVLAMLTLLA